MGRIKQKLNTTSKEKNGLVKTAGVNKSHLHTAAKNGVLKDVHHISPNKGINLKKMGNSQNMKKL